MEIFQKSITLLEELIRTPSFSREEEQAVAIIEQFFKKEGISFEREKNNVWAKNKFFDPEKKTLLLNSHHDTVRPNSGYTRDPFAPVQEDGKLFGLGSNDAGGSLVGLLGTFLHYYNSKDIAYNIVMAATAEEEISGANGIESIWSSLPKIDCVIIGEPTQMKAAIAERGLLVLDCLTTGKAGHAARDEGINAFYEALPDLEWFRTHQFANISSTLGPVKMSVTIINAGQAHNQVPYECNFTVDVRATNAYSHEEILDEIKKNVKCKITPRSMRLKPSSTPLDHPLVFAAKNLHIELFGSPTTSDWSLMPIPGLKIGPGDSARSHSADEFIYLNEIEKGIKLYIELIASIKN